ncbi:MAG: hypothetical protein ACREVN_10325 [Gammaproteobacteria bacterium]
MSRTLAAQFTPARSSRPRPARLFAVLLCALTGLPGIAGAADEEPEFAPHRCDALADVEIAEDAIIGEILIDNRNIFDLRDPRENSGFYRLANRLHVPTRPSVILAQLLFESGDVYSKRLLMESERILRANGYIYDARICPVRYEGSVVDIAVVTRDVWTLTPDIGFTREGGENESRIGFEEANVLGTGISIGAVRNVEVDRSSTSFLYSDPHVAGSWVQLGFIITESSDGEALGLDVERPFYAMDARNSGGFSWLDENRIDPLYDRGDVVEEFRHELELTRVFFGLSEGLKDGWVHRWTFGMGREIDEFSFAPSDTPATVLPEDRKLIYPFIGFQVLEDKFEETMNLDQIGRTEDFFLGTGFSMELGFAGEAFGSDRNAMLFNTSAQYGFEPSLDRLWLLDGTLSGRYEDGSVADALFSGRVRHYRRQDEHNVTFYTLQADVAEDLDRETQLLLGGDSGLRGYPLRYQSGNRRMLATVEQRLFTDYYPWRLFRLGFAAFVDVGRTWGENAVGTDNLGVLKDVGIGMRLGSTRSGSGNVIHVDLAFPLDGEDDISNVQLLFQTKATF